MGRAPIVGIAGRDGPTLATSLRDEGMEVQGTARDGRLPPGLGFVRAAPQTDLRDQAEPERAVAPARPDVVYHRRRSFVSRQSARGAVAIGRGQATRLRLGNPDAPRGRGFDGDHRSVLPPILRYPTAEQFVAVGGTHALLGRCKRAFAPVGLGRPEDAEVDPPLWRAAEPVPLMGNAAEARRLRGWEPALSFPVSVDPTVDAELAAGEDERGEGR